MNFIKAYKYQLGITLGLISVFFIFQNGTCGNASVETSTTGGSGGNTTTTVSPTSTLAVSPQSPTITSGGTMQFSGSGGRAPYTFMLMSGGGTITPSGFYTAPASATTAQIAMRDSNGTVAYSSAFISNPAVLALNGGTSVSVNGTLQFTASGGRAPYSYSVLSGGGSINANGLYTAPANTTTAQVQVVDAISNVAVASVSVMPAATIAKVESNSIFNSGLDVSKAIDNNTGTYYSSTIQTSATPTVAPYVKIYFGTASPYSNFAATVNKIYITARTEPGRWSGFPVAYTIKALNAAGNNWDTVGNFTTQPDFDGIARINFNASYHTKALAIIATTLGRDSSNNYIFQIAELGI